jgi:hypothetical protein
MSATNPITHRVRAMKRELTFEKTVSTQEPQKKQRNDHCNADTELKAFASDTELKAFASKYIPRKIKEETVQSAEWFIKNEKHVPKNADDVNVKFDFSTMGRKKYTKGQVTFQYIGASIGHSFNSKVCSSKLEFHPNGLEAVILSFAPDFKFDKHEENLEDHIQVSFPNSTSTTFSSLRDFCNTFAIGLAMEYKEWCEKNPKLADTNIAQK